MGTLSAALESINEVKKINPSVRTDKIVLIHHSKIHKSPYQYSDKGKTKEEYESEVRKLADDMEADGKILQPLIVRKKGTDDYELIAGQHRRDASRINFNEKGIPAFEFCPCIVVKMTDAQTEYAVNSTNTTWKKTDWHIMHEIERKKYLFEHYPDDFPNVKDKGRMVEKLAAEMGMAKTTVGEYLQISNNLSEKGMELFEKQKINKSAAVALSGLSKEDQNRLLDAGVTNRKDIKSYRENVKAAAVKPEPFQTDGDTVEADDTKDTLPGQYAFNDPSVQIKETCPNCRNVVCVEDTYFFYEKRYCRNCLPDLLEDLADTGLITLDRSSAKENGVMIRS